MTMIAAFPTKCRVIAGFRHAEHDLRKRPAVRYDSAIMSAKTVAAPDLPYRPRDPRSFRPGIALVGCGDITKHHLAAYRAAGYRGVARCDLDETRAIERGEQYFPEAEIYTNYHDVLRRDDVEVVDVATHPPGRPAIVEACLHAGRHVLSQKPFVLDLDVGRRLADLADERGVRLAREGADLVDIGAESSLPHSKRVGPGEQIERIVPVVRALATEGILVSVESYYPEVLAAAAEAGARVFNLTGNEADADVLKLAARHKARATRIIMDTPDLDSLLNRLKVGQNNFAISVLVVVCQSKGALLSSTRSHIPHALFRAATVQQINALIGNRLMILPSLQVLEAAGSLFKVIPPSCLRHGGNPLFAEICGNHGV